VRRALILDLDGVVRHWDARCAPDACLFVDDTPGHVDAARRLGMAAILFSGAAALRAALDL
jgi:FMN phosphatase YigB (HAD superfamily)